MIDQEKMMELLNVPKHSVEEVTSYIKHRYCDEELMAILFELHTSMQKLLFSYQEECIISEETEEEDEVLDEGEYDSMITELQENAKKILVDELSWGFSEDGWNPDLFKEIGLKI